MITVRWIESLREIRLYNDDGDYWPISLRKESDGTVESLKKFILRDPTAEKESSE